MSIYRSWVIIFTGVLSMFNLFKKSFLLLFTALALQGQFFANASEYDSLAIQGSFDQATKSHIFRPFEGILAQAKVASQGMPGVYFTESKPERLHVSIAVVEPVDSQKRLSTAHLDTLTTLARGHLDLDQGYQGHFYKLFLFTNGYNANGEKVNHHYGDPDNARTVKGSNFGFGEEGYKVTHAHIVLRFGTNLTRGVDGQHGELHKAASGLLADVTQ